ncbi:MAG TPA: hypothetical protein VMZ28_01195 [Kofleriaceae bacterium]|nr:hypothetical protein [Kofleriaceae bacterium]
MKVALAALLAFAAGCIDKPGLPSEDADGGPGGDGDGGAIDGDGGRACDGTDLDDVIEWAIDDEIRFDRAQGRLNEDCLDDLVIPGSHEGEGPGVFVVLGRPDNMLTEGFDSFVDTGARVAADVQLINLVGTDALDLVVLATEDAADDSATVLIYAGDGEGGFAPAFAADNTADGVALQIGDPQFPGALFLDTIQLDPTKPVSLLYGDSDTVLTLSPDDWSDDVAVSAADAIEPAGVAIDGGNGLTDVYGVPSGTDGVEDFVLLDFDQIEWYAHQAADAYTLEPMSSAQPGIGRADFGPVDADDQPDVIYSRANGVWVDLLTAPEADADPGMSVQRPFIPNPTYDAAINQFSDLQLAQLDDDERSDLVLLGLDVGGNTKLSAYPNLRVDGTDLVSDEGDKLTVARVDAGPSYDRVVTGTFTADGVVQLFLLTSKPGEVRALCVDPAPLDFCE